MSKYEESLGALNPLFYPSNNIVENGKNNSGTVKPSNFLANTQCNASNYTQEPSCSTQDELGILYQNGIFYTRRDLTNGRFYELMSSTVAPISVIQTTHLQIIGLISS